ncbi:MAG: DegV family protein [Clostridiaceae bacterium]
MNKVKLITDSVCDLTPEMARQLDCDVVPLTINIDNESYLDREEMTVDQLFQRIKDGSSFPTTSQVPPLMFYNIYKKYVDEGYKVISIHLSSKLSGTFQSAHLASLEFPEGTVEVVDSLSATAGQMLLVRHAAELIKEGKSNTEIKAVLDEIKHKIHSLIGVETLEFLTKGGRLSKMTGFVGGVLGIKPILEIKEGEIVPVTKERGSRKALKYIMTKLEEENIDPRHKVILVNSNAPESMEALTPILDEKKIGYEVIHIGGVVGVHIGPGAAAYFLISK